MCSGARENGTLPDGIILALHTIMNEQEQELVRLVSGPRKLSDRAIRDALGCSQGELLVLGVAVRTKLGLVAWADLRAFLRQRCS